MCCQLRKNLEIFGKLREYRRLMKRERSFLHSPQRETMSGGRGRGYVVVLAYLRNFFTKGQFKNPAF